MVKVSTVSIRHAHHAAGSGYPRFADRLGGFADARRLRPVRLPAALLRAGADRVAYDWFGPDQLRVDLTAARRLLTARHEVIHLLYGETDHFYAGRLLGPAHRRGNRLVATFHQPPALLDRLLPAPALFEQLDHAIALGPRAAAHLAALLGPERVSPAFHAVDTDAWRPDRERRASVPTCAIVGSWLRDFATLERAIRRVHSREPRARFEIVTAPGRVAALSTLPGVRARAGIPDAELRDVYARSWLSVVPLIDCVGNNALLEGMACGLPTVATAVGDVAYYTGEDSAVLVEPDDVGAMADAIVALLRDEAARERLGAGARARAERRDLTAAARAHAEIYRRVAAAG